MLNKFLLNKLLKLLHFYYKYDNRKLIILSDSYEVNNNVHFDLLPMLSMN